MTDEFSLRALVRTVYDEGTLTDPGLLSVEVDRRIGDENCRQALRSTLRLFVRHVLSEGRADTTIRKPGKSWKSDGIRETWRRSLQDAVHVGNSEWKRLGQCTYVDLCAAAAERRELASRNRAKAAQFEVLAGLLTEHSAETVDALPADVLMFCLAGAA